MTELRELFPYLIVLILMWNAKQETYFEPYWHLGILDVICVTACYLAWRWFPAKKRLRGRELPFLPLVFQFWESDEEFPPVLKFMWDENVLDYLRFETLYYVMGDFLDALDQAFDACKTEA